MRVNVLVPRDQFKRFTANILAIQRQNESGANAFGNGLTIVHFSNDVPRNVDELYRRFWSAV